MKRHVTSPERADELEERRGWRLPSFATAWSAEPDYGVHYNSGSRYLRLPTDDQQNGGRQDDE